MLTINVDHHNQGHTAPPGLHQSLGCADVAHDDTAPRETLHLEAQLEEGHLTPAAAHHQGCRVMAPCQARGREDALDLCHAWHQ